jgi:hypothetical protein
MRRFVRISDGAMHTSEYPSEESVSSLLKMGYTEVTNSSRDFDSLLLQREIADLKRLLRKADEMLASGSERLFTNGEVYEFRKEIRAKVG